MPRLRRLKLELPILFDLAVMCSGSLHLPCTQPWASWEQVACAEGWHPVGVTHASGLVSLSLGAMCSVLPGLQRHVSISVNLYITNTVLLHLINMPPLHIVTAPLAKKKNPQRKSCIYFYLKIQNVTNVTFKEYK